MSGLILKSSLQNRSWRRATLGVPPACGPHAGSLPKAVAREEHPWRLGCLPQSHDGAIARGYVRTACVAAGVGMRTYASRCARV